jgi:hypothetical protein
VKPNGAVFIVGGLVPFVTLFILWMGLTAMAPRFGGVALSVFFLGVFSAINVVTLAVLWVWASVAKNEGEAAERRWLGKWAVRYLKIGGLLTLGFLLFVVLWPDCLRSILFIVDRAFPAEK